MLWQHLISVTLLGSCLVLHISAVCIDDLGNDFGGVVQDFGTYLSARLYVLHDYTVPWDGLVYKYKVTVSKQ